MHTKDDLNYSRGYEWWLMREAKKRNPNLTLDACAWGCPGWVGNGNFWSQDMCDYYVKWIQGLKSVYGLDLDAIGCRNEKGVNEDFVKNSAPRWTPTAWKKSGSTALTTGIRPNSTGSRHMTNDVELRNAVAIFSNHTMATSPTPPDVRQAGRFTPGTSRFGTPRSMSTRRVSTAKSASCRPSTRILSVSGVTKIVNWYLVGSVYPMESVSGRPGRHDCEFALERELRTPRSGCGDTRTTANSRKSAGSISTALRETGRRRHVRHAEIAGQDYSVIIETKGARPNQNVTFNVSGGLSTGKLCVWRSDAAEQFVQQDGINPQNGSFTIALEPDPSIPFPPPPASRKGSFDNIPAETKISISVLRDI
jgi:galactosylceramidase